MSYVTDIRDEVKRSRETSRNKEICEGEKSDAARRPVQRQYGGYRVYGTRHTWFSTVR